MKNDNTFNNESNKEKKLIYMVMLLTVIIIFVGVFFAIKNNKIVKKTNNFIAEKIIQHIITSINKKNNIKITYKNITCQNFAKNSTVCYINNVTFKKNNQTIFTAKRIKITNVITFAKLVDEYKNKKDISKYLKNFNMEIGFENMRVPDSRYNLSNVPYFKKHYKYPDIDVADYFMNAVLVTVLEKIKDPEARKWIMKDLNDMSNIKKYTYIGFKISTNFNDANKTKLNVKNNIYIVSGNSSLNIGVIYSVNNWHKLIYTKIKSKSDYANVLKNIFIKKIIIEYNNKEKNHLKNLNKYILSKVITNNNIKIKGQLTDKKVSVYFNELLISLGEKNKNKVEVYNIESYVKGNSHVKIEFIFNDSLYNLASNVIPLYFVYLRKFGDPDTALGFTIFNSLSIFSEKILLKF